MYCGINRCSREKHLYSNFIQERGVGYFQGWAYFREIMIMVYLDLVYRYLFQVCCVPLITCSIPAHKHICIFTIMSTNEPFSKGGLIQSQPLCNTCFSQYQGSVQAYAQVSMGLYIHNMDIWMYRSLAKKGPLSNIRPPPITASIFCKGLKFTPKSAHPIDLVRKVFECNTMQG